MNRMVYNISCLFLFCLHKRESLASLVAWWRTSEQVTNCRIFTNHHERSRSFEGGQNRQNGQNGPGSDGHTQREENTQKTLLLELHALTVFAPSNACILSGLWLWSKTVLANDSHLRRIGCCALMIKKLFSNATQDSGFSHHIAFLPCISQSNYGWAVSDIWGSKTFLSGKSKHLPPLHNI